MDILLSSGVIVALITGISSIAVTLLNSRRVSKLEHEREQFQIEEANFALVKDAYEQFWCIDSPLSILNSFAKDGIVSEAGFKVAMKKCDMSCAKYFELMNRLSPYLDDDLLPKWQEAVEKYDDAIRHAAEVAQETGSSPTGDVIQAIFGMESACKEILNEQIKRRIRK